MGGVASRDGGGGPGRGRDPTGGRGGAKSSRRREEREGKEEGEGKEEREEKRKGEREENRGKEGEEREKEGKEQVGREGNPDEALPGPPRRGDRAVGGDAGRVPLPDAERTNRLPEDRAAGTRVGHRPGGHLHESPAARRADRGDPRRAPEARGARRRGERAFSRFRRPRAPFPAGRSGESRGSGVRRPRTRPGRPRGSAPVAPGGFPAPQGGRGGPGGGGNRAERVREVPLDGGWEGDGDPVARCLRRLTAAGVIPISFRSSAPAAPGRVPSSS